MVYLLTSILAHMIIIVSILVSGVIKEIRKVTGKVVLDVYKKEDGNLAVVDGDVGYQFTQERGLVIIDSPIGVVAMIPVGMGIVSSINFTADEGETLVKGEELELCLWRFRYNPFVRGKFQSEIFC